MSLRPHRRSLTRLLPLAILLAWAATGLAATQTPAAIDITLQLADGMKTTHDQPRIVLWLEDTSRRFIRTAFRFGTKEPKHYQDLPVSYALYTKAELPADVDAVTGATVLWGTKGQVRLPCTWKGLDLLSGRYVLRIESAKDHAKHFATFAIPLNQKTVGKTFDDKGYVTSVEISAVPDGTAAPEAPVMIPVPGSAAPTLAPGTVETAVCTGTVTLITKSGRPKEGPSFTMSLDGSGDLVEFWTRKKQPESAANAKLILAMKKGERKTVTYTEQKGSRAITIEDAKPGSGK